MYMYVYVYILPPNRPSWLLSALLSQEAENWPFSGSIQNTLALLILDKRGDHRPTAFLMPSERNSRSFEAAGPTSLSCSYNWNLWGADSIVWFCELGWNCGKVPWTALPIPLPEPRFLHCDRVVVGAGGAVDAAPPRTSVPHSEWLKGYKCSLLGKQMNTEVFLTESCCEVNLEGSHLLWSMKTPHPKLRFPGSSVSEESTCNVGASGDLSSTPGLGGPPGEGSDHPLQYSCLQNPMDWGDWWDAFHSVSESWTWLSTHAKVLFPLCYLNSHHLPVKLVARSTELEARGYPCPNPPGSPGLAKAYTFPSYILPISWAQTLL